MFAFYLHLFMKVTNKSYIFLFKSLEHIWDEKLQTQGCLWSL